MEALIVSLLFPTLAGYIILTKAPCFQYHYENTGYQRLLLESALVGILLLLLVTVLEALLVYCLPSDIEIKTLENWFNLQESVQDVSNIKINSESFLTIILSVLFVSCFQIYKIFKKNKYNEFIAKRKISADPNCLANLFVDCFTRIQPVMVNLKNRKSYIGLVTDLGEATDLNKKKFIRILPTASGYRDRENLDFQPQHSYNWLDIASRLANEDENFAENIAATLKVSMVINLEEIVSATVWVEDLYEDIQSSNPSTPHLSSRSRHRR